MQVKNTSSGDIETMRYGPARDAVAAGTHEFHNEKAGAEVEPTPDEATDAEGSGKSLDEMTRDELIAEAERVGVDVSSGDNKADIKAKLEAA